MRNSLLIRDETDQQVFPLRKIHRRHRLTAGKNGVRSTHELNPFWQASGICRDCRAKVFCSFSLKELEELNMVKIPSLIHDLYGAHTPWNAIRPGETVVIGHKYDGRSAGTRACNNTAAVYPTQSRSEKQEEKHSDGLKQFA
jgi:hypothetical protein